MISHGFMGEDYGAYSGSWTKSMWTTLSEWDRWCCKRWKLFAMHMRAVTELNKIVSAINYPRHTCSLWHCHTLSGWNLIQPYWNRKRNCARTWDIWTESFAFSLHFPIWVAVVYLFFPSHPFFFQTFGLWNKSRPYVSIYRDGSR